MECFVRERPWKARWSREPPVERASDRAELRGGESAKLRVNGDETISGTRPKGPGASPAGIDFSRMTLKVFPLRELVCRRYEERRGPTMSQT